MPTSARKHHQQRAKDHAAAGAKAAPPSAGDQPAPARPAIPVGDVLKSRYEAVKARIAAAAKKSGRSPNDVLLVAVTKNAAIDQIRQLIELGQQDFGENRVQNLEKRMLVVEEFLRRHRELSSGKTVRMPESVRWHMIGHLQRNKARKVAGRVRLIHSVDSMRLIEELHACSQRLDRPIEILLQVNVSGEDQKFGLAPAAVRHVVDQVDTMLGLTPRGMMCMAPYSDNPEHSRPVFERCAELFEEVRREGSGGERFDILSMGMSGDFEVGIEYGSNLVRVGTAIFGEAAAEEPDDDGEDEGDDAA